MEFSLFEVCNLCRRMMIDPKILPCAHSFCLKCLESLTSSGKHSECPTCGAAFELPEGGPKDLKNNEFIACLTVYKANAIKCGLCRRHRSTNFCFDCALDYCSSCLEVHKNAQLMTSHRTIANVSSGNIPCRDHFRWVTMFCKVCDIPVCPRCIIEKHNTHEVNHILVHYKFQRNNLKREIAMLEALEIKVLHNKDKSKKLIHEHESRAINSKRQIQERVDSIRKAIDVYADNLLSNIDRELEYNKNVAEDVIVKLSEMEIRAKMSIEILRQKLKGLDYSNLQASHWPVASSGCEVIPEYSLKFNATFLTGEPLESFVCEKVIGTLKSEETENMTFDALSASLKRDLSFNLCKPNEGMPGKIIRGRQKCQQADFIK